MKERGRQRQRQPFMWDSPREPVPELSETEPNIPLSLSSNSLQALSTFPPEPPSLPLWSNITENPGTRLKET